MIGRFGFVPVSVLRLSRGARSRQLFNLLGERARAVRGAESRSRLDAKVTAAGRARAEERLARGMFGSVVESETSRDRQTDAMGSVMAAELVEFVLRYYARTGQTVLDPFAGHGVRMQVAWQLGMPYYGYDICDEFVDYIEAVIAKIDDDTTTLSVTRGDTRHPDAVPDGIGDVCFTSPPYWDVEYYGPEPGQLGAPGTTYTEFMVSMTDVARAWLPKFRPGAYVVINVNDIRRDGRLISYHSDTIRAWSDAGYVLHDTWIVEGLVAQLPRAFGVRSNMKRIAPKVHEYLLVFRVPAGASGAESDRNGSDGDTAALTTG